LLINLCKFSTDQSELSYILKDLVTQYDPKSDDPIGQSISYLRHLSSCTHVVGSTFTYIQESTHNRKSFVYSFMKSLEGFEESYEITPVELHLMLEGLYPGFPRSVVLESALTALGSYSTAIVINEVKIPILTLARSVCFHVLYEEWLKVVEEVFKDEGRAMGLGATRLRTKAEDLLRTLPRSMYLPPLAAILGAIDGIASADSSGSSSEVTFDKLKKGMCKHAACANELTLLACYPATL
jgi:hypothetical protein